MSLANARTPHVLVAASVARRHLGRGRQHATQIALRLLPAPVRRAASRLPTSRPVTSSGDLAACRGRSDGSAQPAAQKVSERRRGQLAATAIALGDHALAKDLLDQIPAGTRRHSRLAALLAERTGELTTALEYADAAGAPRLRRRLAAERAVLTPGSAAEPSLLPRHTAKNAEEVTGRRVLHVVTNALPETVAGYTLRTHGIATAQRAAGLDVHVATRLGFPVTKGHLRARATHEIDGVAYHRLIATVPARADDALAKDVERTARLVERLRPSVLHAHTNHLNGQVALALRERFGIPVVYEVRGFLEETKRSSDGLVSETYRLAQQAETWCMEQADAVVTLSQTMADAIVGRGIDPAKITVVPNGVPDSLLEGATTPQLRGSGPLTAGFVGTLNDYEGVDVLIRAVAKAGVHLLVVGDGPARAALEAQADGLPVTFTGRVRPEEVAKQYAAIDVFCLPRRDLPVTRLVQPLKPLEAMALGRPVIASDLPPLREIVTDETGRLVPPDDDVALADALTDLAAQPDLRQALGAAARDWVATNRTWSRAATAYADIYAQLEEHSHDHH